MTLLSEQHEQMDARLARIEYALGITSDDPIRGPTTPADADAIAEIETAAREIEPPIHGAPRHQTRVTTEREADSKATDAQRRPG